MAKRTATPIEPQTTGGRQFAAAPDITAITHGDQVYRVIDGRVSLPANEAWYQPLIDAGLLTPQE